MDIVALELIRHLQKIDHENEYFILVRRDKDRHVLTKTENFHIIELPSVAYPVWEQYYLPRAIKRIKPDILHCTSNTAPLRLSKQTFLVLTLHDILFMEKPAFSNGNWYQRFGNLYRRWIVPKVIPNCSRIITVSDFEKTRIIQYFNLSSLKISMIHNAYNKRFNENERINNEQFTIHEKKYHLPERYLLYLGNTDPKKNMKNVLKAYSIYCHQNKQILPLVLPDVKRIFLETILRSIHAPGLSQYIYLTGYIPNEELPSLYRGAFLFLYPSFYESFGIPLLEAMASGVPVISSISGAMPEVAGGAALLVNPEKPDEIAAALTRIIEDKALYDSLKQKGLQRSAEFSWLATARAVQRLYREILVKTPPESIKTIIP